MSYDGAIKTAQKLIKARGQSVKWIKVSTGKDLSQPWKIVDSDSVEHDVDIVFLPVNRSNLESFSMRDGVNIAKVSCIGYMGAVSFTPKIGESVKRGDKTLFVEYIDIVAPSGEPILYTVLFRG